MGAGDDLSLRTTSFGTLMSVLLWVASNVGTLFLNKAVLTSYKFDFPITLTALHVRALLLKSRPARPGRRNVLPTLCDDSGKIPWELGILALRDLCL